MQSPVAAGDKFRKIKANERNHTCRIISEFNADFTNFAPLKLNVVQISLGYKYANGAEIEVYPSDDTLNPDFTCEIWIAVK